MILKKKTLKRIFFSSLKMYFSFFRKRKIFPRLELLWLKSHLFRLKFYTPKVFGALRSDYLINRRNKRKRLEKPTRRLFSKLELLKDQNYFCFKTLSQLRKYLKRVEHSRRPDITFLGLEGSFLNLVFRANLVRTTREARAFIKLGAFTVNKLIVKNPYKILSVFDVFQVHASFVKVVWKSFFLRVRQRVFFVNIPNYIDFNYRLLRFFIWRLPTQLERRFVHYFPFIKSQNDKLDFFPDSRGRFIVPLDYEKDVF